MLWSRFEVLFNAKHPLYYNKEEKGKALNKIKEGLELNEWIFSTKDTAHKIVDLRNYYGAQRRIVEACKKGGAGANEIYESKWKFFNQLNFLNDSLIPRNSKRDKSSWALCSPENVGSVLSTRKYTIYKIQEKNGRKSNKWAARCCKLNSNENPIITTQSKSADKMFRELVVKTLGEIKDCEEKEN